MGPSVELNHMGTTARRVVARPAGWRAWPSLGQVWVLAAVALIALRVLLTPIVPNDFWWHMATGRVIAQTWHIPTVDHFSYTAAGQTYYNQPWLAQTLMYALYRLGGAAMLLVVQAVVVAGTWWSVLGMCRRAAVSVPLAVVLVLVGAAVGMDNWQIRPQTYALPLFATAFAILDRWRRVGRAALWVLPLVMLVWVNLHGTWTLLIGLCGMFWCGAIGEKLRSKDRSVQSWHAINNLCGWSVVTLLATLVNPRGDSVWHYVGQLVTNRAVSQLVPEWAAPWRVPWEAFTIIFWIVLGLVSLLVVRQRRRLAWTDALLSVVFTLLAFGGVRNILWWGLALAPVAARLVAPATPPAPRRRVELLVANRLIVGLLGAALLATLPWWKPSLGLPPQLGNVLDKHTPVEAVAHLQRLAQRPQRLFHGIEAGSYLIWAMPEQRVFVDGRIELYPYNQWRDFITLNQGWDVDALAQRYNIDGWLLDPATQAPLIAALKRSDTWRQVFATRDGVYFDLMAQDYSP